MSDKPKIEVWFELENKCNLKCKFCYNYWKAGFHPEPKSLSAKELILCFKNLQKVADCQKIALSGGEPLLRKDLFELLDYLSTLSVPMVLTSNGLLLNDETIDKLIQRGVITFEVPLHSMQPDVHNFLSGVNCHDESLNTVISLRSKRVNVVPVFVATTRNLHHFIGVLETCKLLELENVIFNRVIPGGLALLNKEEIGIPTDSDISEILSECYSFAKENKITIHLGVPVTLSSKLWDKHDYIISASCPVKVSQKRWTVDSGGNLRRCNHSHISIGNLLNGGEINLKTELSKILDCDNRLHPCQFIAKDEVFDIVVT